MPKKINVVSLSDIKPVEENDVDTNNDIDERNQITEAIKEEEELSPPEDVTQMEVEKPKPKRKPAPKKAKVVEEVAPVIETVVEEVKPEPVAEQPPKKIKTLELVKCEKCGKEMTKRTLRYDHDKTCKGAPIKREDIPVQKRVKKPATPKQTPAVVATVPSATIPEGVEHVIEREVNKRIQDRLLQKVRVKEEKIKKLAALIA